MKNSTKVHVLIPYTTESLCGLKGHQIYRNTNLRGMITCKNCRKHPDFKMHTRVK